MIISCLLPIDYKNLLEDRRGVSPVVGMILILSIVMVSVGIIYTTGIPFIDSIKYATQVSNAKNSFSVLQNDVLEIINGPVTGVGMGRITKVDMGGGSIFVEPNNTEIQINYTGSSNPVTAVPGTITYEYKSRGVVFENGAVFSKYTTSSFMEMEPLIYASDLGSGNIGLMIHIINVTGANSSTGGEGTGKIRTSFEERVNLYSGEVGNVNITISSQNNDSWGRYFNDTLSNAGLASSDFSVYQSDGNVEIKISSGNYIQLSIYETKILARGQAIPVEYILIFTISMIFLGLTTLTFNSAVDSSSRQAIYIELTDTGNLISSAITNIYVTTPCNGVNSISLDVPDEIAGTGYFVEISGTGENPYENNKALKLTSMRKSVTTYVPLNSIDALIKINGSASSSSGKILIISNTSEITISQG